MLWHYDPSKCRKLLNDTALTSQKISFLSNTALKTSNLATLIFTYIVPSRFIAECKHLHGVLLRGQSELRSLLHCSRRINIVVVWATASLEDLLLVATDKCFCVSCS
jgi:hypothetical protein